MERGEEERGGEWRGGRKREGGRKSKRGEVRGSEDQYRTV